MANLQRRNPSRYADPWRDLFDIDLWGNRAGNKATSLPAVNIGENDQSFMVDVVAPGFKKEDFKINIDDDLLTISAETKQENKEAEGKEYTRREYSYSSFTRSFQLPDNAKADAIAAKYEDGILKITIPKTEQKPKASKQISIE
ncbi:Hsp20/alpha crystallin family protein [Chitinophagaceae bacterium LB-8]|uniref:Hsp20/alpha crystallin family protein n=1 Tax=Paraflavisolibacter caeni TaxID=2982496 RepID=A0A9X2XPV0_9BACT|nr:Hsp20/alpha crystallin family protein [Paraflavisolibacter caeni]MCU7551879.1 Hsp20/alpha crystallin family protein [Paraflavisolibacter caeni]